MHFFSSPDISCCQPSFLQHLGLYSFVFMFKAIILHGRMSEELELQKCTVSFIINSYSEQYCNFLLHCLCKPLSEYF